MAQKLAPELSAARYDIPAQYVNEIGRIVVRLTYFEHCLRAIIWNLAQVDQRVGRLAIRDQGVGESIDIIRDLLALRGMSIKNESILPVRARALEISGLRDLVVHGAWGRGADRRWRVIKIREDRVQHVSDPRIERRLNTEAVTVRIEGLRAIASGIEPLIKWARALSVSIGKRLPPTRQRSLPSGAA
jgi:hypothetical protein